MTPVERAFYVRWVPSFHIKPDVCAVTMSWAMGHGGGNCPQPPTVRAVWPVTSGDGAPVITDVEARHPPIVERVFDVGQLWDVPAATLPQPDMARIRWSAPPVVPDP